MIHHEATKGTKNTKARALRLSHTVIGAAIEVHRHLGPGLLESVYQAALCQELRLRDVDFQSQVSLPLQYKGSRLEGAVRIDLVVGCAVIVEIKAVDHLAPIHHAQLLTYLKLTGHSVGLLINFNVGLLRKGVRRILNG